MGGNRSWQAAIPAYKMKMRQPHLVPPSAGSLLLLDALRPLTGAGRFCFPSIRSPSRPMSENTVNAALRRLGYFARRGVQPRIQVHGIDIAERVRLVQSRRH
jgi:hypothetical protein